MGLIDLPDDVLFDLTWYLSIEDVLSLKQVGAHPYCVRSKQPAHASCMA